MPATPSQPDSTVADKEIVVVLVQPALLGSDPDLATLGKTLASAAGNMNVRVLLCLSDRTDQTIADALAKTGLDVEILLGRDIEPPHTANFLQVPPGTSVKERNEFALALSDVVLAAPQMKKSPLGDRAAELNKPVVTPGEPLPVISRAGRTTAHLDPDVHGWHAQWWPRVFGRCEQSIIELLAFSWRAPRDGAEDTVAERRKKLRAYWSRTWWPAAYFAPSAWRELAPDRTAIDDASKIVSCFNAMDRSAKYGSYIHRDFVWWEYLGAAFAVLFAVIGEWSRFHKTLGALELLLLVFVMLLVLAARYFCLQDRWMACRLGAEQLRIARMSLPLLVVPPALATADTPPAAARHGRDKAEFGRAALTEVKQAVRAQGLPRVDPAFTLDQAVKWVRLIVGDQIDYHRRNHRKLEMAERRLQFVTGVLFVLAVLAVLRHLLVGPGEWLLLFTAAAPAFAAALHGAAARLGIVHRAALSADAEKELTRIDNDLAKPAGLPAEDSWRQVRRLTLEAADAMGRENTSWHGLVRRYPDHLP